MPRQYSPACYASFAYDKIIEQGDKLFVTFIDYSAASDSMIHKFLDQSLKKAIASGKTRAIFRTIYAVAEGTARVRGLLNGKNVYSAEFQVRTGVIIQEI